MPSNFHVHRGELAWNKDLDYLELYRNASSQFNLLRAPEISNALMDYTSYNDGNGSQDNAPYIHINRYVSQRLFGIPSRFIEVSGAHRYSALVICDLLHHRAQSIQADILYRAWKVSPVIFEGLEAGQEVKLNQIISTTIAPHALPNFLADNGILMRIKNAYGIPVSGQEAEFLLPPGSKFLITDVYRVDFEDSFGERFENITVYDVDMVAGVNALPLLDDFKWWHLFW